MHDSVGISMRPRLTSTIIAANSSVRNLSRWGATPAPHPLSSLSNGNGRRRVDMLSMREIRASENLGFAVGLRGAAGVVDLTKADRLSTGWGMRNGRQTKLGLGFGNDGRESVVCNARRGFLSELQNMKLEKEDAEKVPVEFESPLQIVLYPDPRLRKKNKRVTVFDEKLEQLVKEMFDVMYRTDGVGLAAPQVGVNVQLMLYNPEGERGSGQEYILVNPKIVKYGKQRDFFTEGCLSFLTLEADVERPLSVRVEAQDIRGKKFGISLKGWQARIFQHEYDHLEGVLYHDRMTPAEVDKIRPGLVRLEEEYERGTGQPAPERVK